MPDPHRSVMDASWSDCVPSVREPRHGAFGAGLFGSGRVRGATEGKKYGGGCAASEGMSFSRQWAIFPPDMGTNRKRAWRPLLALIGPDESQPALVLVCHFIFLPASKSREKSSNSKSASRMSSFSFRTVCTTAGEVIPVGDSVTPECFFSCDHRALIVQGCFAAPN